MPDLIELASVAGMSVSSVNKYTGNEPMQRVRTWSSNTRSSMNYRAVRINLKNYVMLSSCFQKKKVHVKVVFLQFDAAYFLQLHG